MDEGVMRAKRIYLEEKFQNNLNKTNFKLRILAPVSCYRIQNNYSG